MNATRIDWATHVCNPVTGCFGPHGTAANPQRCDFCYAHRMAPRIAAMRAATTGEPVCQQCRDFVPHLHPERLHQLREGRGRRVFIGSMCDMWSEGVKQVWRSIVFGQVYANFSCDKHPNTHIVLTKRPDRICYGEVSWHYQHDAKPIEFNGRWWPANLWLGTSVTDDMDYQERWPALCEHVPEGRRVLSVEPLREAMELDYPLPDWLIVGPQTPLRPSSAPSEERVRDLVLHARDDGIPLWLKSSCFEAWPDLPHIQQLPEAMAR